jgi:hypothetical protein
MPALVPAPGPAPAVEEWAIAQILAIMLDQIEGGEDCGAHGLARRNSSNAGRSGAPVW